MGFSMKWFNEHLNWTYALIFVITAIIMGIMIPFSENLPLFITGIVLSFILTWGGSAWVLWKKGQSLWYLALMLVFSFVFIIVFVLPNKRMGQGDGKKIDDTDYYKERESAT